MNRCFGNFYFPCLLADLGKSAVNAPGLRRILSVVGW